MYKYFVSLLNTLHKRHFPTRCDNHYSEEFCEATNHLRYHIRSSDEYYESDYVFDANGHGLRYEMRLLLLSYYYDYDLTQWRVGKLNKIVFLSKRKVSEDCSEG